MSQEGVRPELGNFPTRQTAEGNEPAVGEASQRILLLLSTGQSLSIHEISRALGLTMETAWKDLALLEQGKQIILSDGRIQLGPEGLHSLQQWGIIKPIVTSAPSPSPSTLKRPLALVGMFPDLVIWAIVPLGIVIAVFVIWGLAWALLQGVPFDERIVEIPIGLVVTTVAFIPLQKYWQLSFHQIPTFESYVVFRLGNCIGSRGPGPTLLNPLLDRWNIVDLRVCHLEVPHETCITRDNVQIDVDFVLYWKVEQPVWSVTKVQSPQESLNLLATALLRAVIAHFPFNEVLNQRERINEFLKEKIDEISTDWGVYVTTVEIREIKPPKDIVDSMHLQAAAEWKRQATVTEAQGYKEAAIKRAERDSQALDMLFKIARGIDPKTLQLKYLDALADLGKSNSTKYIFPLEFTQLIKPFVQSSQTDAASSEAANASHPQDKMETEDIMNQGTEAGGSEDKHFSSPNASTASLPKARVIGQEDQKAA